jgi:hypothetical protein
VSAENISVGDASCEFDLLLEAVEEVGILLNDIRSQELEGHVLVELSVMSSVHDAHAALPERLPYFIPVR